MKTAKDPRHQKRRERLKSIFAQSFAKQPLGDDFVKELLEQKEKIDAEIQKSAPEWPVDKLNKVDLAILRMAVFELKKENTPPKVVIDEAVELAKEFGSENSASFINGVLGTIYQEDGK